jgi:hypothetical protein
MQRSALRPAFAALFGLIAARPSRASHLSHPSRARTFKHIQRQSYWHAFVLASHTCADVECATAKESCDGERFSLYLQWDEDKYARATSIDTAKCACVNEDMSKLIQFA